ncbi:TonB-dependent receptor [Glycocaulis alkaliphilus]|uniref:TonB-dependent receptor n=1 Tax=Glycocaulis alkaliphilus TaxID=1434191 RepID=A0A3T0EAX2_9PROT|nr:TonB-dependent receptor [Glycocaulis alkaliphilus]AZU04551.1 TonB-dependent receptor [Glycocaulis alkaliphilus]GGB69580.1 TonB-dependent receptor [Glycocaulis alkaliphilus]
MKMKFVRAALLAAASPIVLAGGAFAQTAGEPGAQRQLEVITVTAQQREQSLQDVPVAVSAFNQAQLENSGIQDIKDLIALAPGLMVTSTQSETITTARVRGVGTVGDNFGLESSVGVYIDGVFRARNGVGFGDLGELERIEVLRGPQGTLFGKNTSAGVLNIMTQQPEFEFGGQAELQVGNYDLRRLSGSITGPIVEDQLAFRLFAVTNQRDGFTTMNLRDGGTMTVTDSENQDYYSIRGQLLWTPSATVTGRIIADFSDRSEFCCSAVQWDYDPTIVGIVGSLGGQVLSPADPSARQAFANTPYQQDVTDWGLSAEFDVDFDGATLTSITAFRHWENERTQDVDYSSLDIANRLDGNFTDLDRFSQEFRLQGVRGNLDWLVGGFYSREELELGDSIRFGADWEPFLGILLAGNVAGVSQTISNLTGGAVNIPVGQAIVAGTGVNQDIYNQTATSWAAFTHNTYAFTDRFSVTAGLRYTREEKDLTASFSTNSPAACAALEGAFGFDPIAGFQQSAAPAVQAGLLTMNDVILGSVAIGNMCLPYARSGLDANGYDQSRTDEEVSGTLRAQYDLTDDVMIYGGYSRGFKAGGFNLDRQFNGPFDATGYTNVDTSFAPETISAWEAGFKSTLFGNVLQLNGNLFYQDIEDFQLNTFNGTAFVVESVDEARSYGAEFDFLWLTPVDGLDISGGYAYVNTLYETVDTGDGLIDALEGESFSLSPEHFFNLAVNYEASLGNNLITRMGLDSRYVSGYNTGSDNDPEKFQDAFTLINARIGIGSNDERWFLELWGRNLTDETYAQVAIDAFAQGRRGQAGFDAGEWTQPRNTASYAAFLGAPRTYGITLRTRF